MRLTLRTMLAYLDNVLEPADAEILGKKIDESEFAGGLVERVHGAMRKLRLDAPKLDGKGMGNDPNTVSEYLDSSLPQDRVGEFERLCLESDKHLAEVASCHQILTLVLGKPAGVPESLRERVYALAHPDVDGHPPLPKRTPVPPDAQLAAPPVAAESNGKAAVVPAKPEVPEYLRAGRRTSPWPLVAAAALALLVVLGVLRMMGPFNGSHPLARLFGGGPAIAQNDRPVVPADTEQNPPGPVDDTDATDADTATKRLDRENDGKTSIAAAASLPDADPATGTDSAPMPDVPDSAPAVVERPAADSASSDAAATATTDTTAPAADVADAAPSPDATPMPDEGIIPVVPPPPPAPGTDIAAADATMDVGRYTSDAQVMASLDTEEGLWYAKAPRAVLLAGERLIALPPFRPQVALPSGVQVTLAGETAIQMERPGESGASRMTVDWGRFLIVTVGAAGAQLEVNLAGIEGMLTLVDADSSVAVKVSRWLPPGTDPETVGSVPVVEIFATHGRVTWQENEKEKVSIPASHVHVYLATNSPETIGPFTSPEWIDARSVPPIDRQAAIVLETMIEPDRALNLVLLEAMQDRRVEIRALAARCVAFLGDFEPIVRQLGDDRQYAFWATQVESLKQAVAASPQSAAAVREAFGRLRPDSDKELYRLLWGYSPEQLEKGGAASLVKLLESDQMDVRVLTFANLVAITGAQEFYRPERQPQQMRAAIQNWKQRLDKGTIAYKLEPSPLQNYRPLAEPPAGAETRTGSPTLPLDPGAGTDL